MTQISDLPVSNASVAAVHARDLATLRVQEFVPTLGRHSRLVFLTDPCGLAAEQYRILRRRITDAHPAGGALLLTSPGPGEGKTLTSINLACAMAEAGYSICLVDLDLRAPGVANTLGTSVDGEGVEDVLEQHCKLDDALGRVANTGLHVLPVRKRRNSVGQLLSPACTRPMLVELRRRFKWVLLDFAPAIPMADVNDVLGEVDGALMIVRFRKTSSKMISPSLEILRRKLWGVVQSDAHILGSAYYGGYGTRR